MRRLLRWRVIAGAVGGLAIVFAVLLAVVPFIVPADTLRRGVAVQLSSLTGQPVSVGGQSTFRMMPWPTVTISSVVIGGDPGVPPIVEGTAIEASLAPLALLAGRVDVVGVALIEPRIALVVDEAGRSNWRSGVSILTLFTPDDGSGQRPPRLGQLEIRRGSLVYRDVPAQRRTTLSDVDLSVFWPQFDSRLTVEGRLRHNGEVLSVKGALARPAALFRGDISALDATLESASLRAQVAGEVFAARDMTVEGNVTFSSPSARRLAQWLVPELVGGPEIGAVQGTARLRARERGLSFEAIRMSVDRTRAEGVLALTFDSARPRVQGTLDFGQLDVTPFLQAQVVPVAPQQAAAPGGPAGQVSAGAPEAEALRRDPLGAIDVDLRISVTNLLFGQTTVRDAAVSMLTRDGRAELNLGDGAVYGGRISGRLVIETQPGSQPLVARTRAALNLAGIRAEDLLREHFGIVRLVGQGHVAIQLQGEGSTTRAVQESLRGEATFRVANGGLTGLDLAGMMRRAERSPVEALLEARTGRTPIEQASATLRLSGGVIATDDLVMRGQGYRLAVRGQTDLSSRTLNLAGSVQGVSADPARPPLELPFVVRGPWTEPLVVPNPEALMRRTAQ